MEAEEFVDNVLSVLPRFPWIARSEVKRFKNRVRIRLWLNKAFVDIYHNAEERITSYAYVEGGRRLFEANNMRIGWHLHTFGEIEEHVHIPPLSAEEFLKMLEEELKKRDKL
ncbi:MAG: hypothetical protein AYL30_006790 [Candidatus Hecatellales archaeon B24]|nr:MAG: hypothetical protein AYL30_006790 [Candidatus Hecatellales archaeon B24]